jgi:hypothetical protein
VADVDRERDKEERYEAIPYQFHELRKILSGDASAAVRASRALYKPGDPLFQFRGARLFTAIFPEFPESVAAEFLVLAANGSDDDLGFIVQVLRAYQGQPTMHQVVKELIAKLPENDGRLELLEICLQSTGVVAGEYGLVEAYRARKGQIEEWRADDRPKVRGFAERFARRLDQSIAAEQRRAEQGKEMRRLAYDAPENE